MYSLLAFRRTEKDRGQRKIIGVWVFNLLSGVEVWAFCESFLQMANQSDTGEKHAMRLKPETLGRSYLA